MNFFVLEGETVKWNDIKLAEEDLPKGPSCIRHKTAPYMFPEYLRICNFGEVLDSVLIKIIKQYPGYLYSREQE